MMPLLIAGGDRRRRPARGPRSCWRPSGWRGGCRIGRPRSPAASSSAPRWRGRWPPIRSWCWRTSPRAISISGNSERLHELFARLSREFETALVVVTHNRSLAGRADRVLSLEGGQLVAARRAWSRCPDVVRPVPRAGGGHPPHPDRERAGDDPASLRAMRRREGGREPRRAAQDAAGELSGRHGQGRADQTPVARGADACARCGATLQDFRESGRLGCAECYQAFEVPLRDLLRRLHGSTHHMGERYVDPGQATAAEDGRQGLPTCGSSSGSPWRPRTSSWPPSCATDCGCWNDRSQSADRRRDGVAGRVRPLQPPRALHPDPAGAQPRRAGVPGAQLGDRARGDPAPWSSGPLASPSCSAGPPRSGSTGWTGPTGSCCTSGTW